jgi:phage-related protein (TIGR01555 family)
MVGIKKSTVARARRDETKTLKDLEKAGRTVAKAAQTADAQVSDSFQNFALQLGVGTDNAMSGSTYGFNPITRLRVLLEWAYRGSWIAAISVDAVADDMTRGGIDLQSTIPPDEVERLHKAFTKFKIWQSLNETIKWARLYGGAIAVYLIDGQDFSTPLRIDTIGRDQFKGLLVLDRWMIEPSLNDLVTVLGPDMGMPKYYTVTTDGPALRGQKIHHSRVIRFDGIKLPYWQKIAENLWGLSVLERLYDRLVAFDSATQGLAQAMHKMHLRIIKIDKLRALIAAGGPAYNAVLQQVAMMRRFQSNEGITILDGADDYVPNQVNINAGYSDALIQFGQQVSGANGIPLVRMFGQSPAGLNSTGESDIRLYYDGVNEDQENDLRVPLIMVGNIVARSEEIALPEEWSFKFRPLWQLKEPEKADINAKEAATILDAQERGIVDHPTALKELRESGRRTGHWSNITDEIIKQAEQEPAPSAAEMQAGGAPGMPGQEPGSGEEPGAGEGGKKLSDLLPKPRLISSLNSKDNARRLPFIRIAGLPVRIECFRGNERWKGGPTWPADYGYIEGTKSAEGPDEAMDCFVGPYREAGMAWIFDHNGNDGRFEEHKIMLGYRDPDTARADYALSYGREPAGWLAYRADELAHWLKTADVTRPVTGTHKVMAA